MPSKAALEHSIPSLPTTFAASRSRRRLRRLEGVVLAFAGYLLVLALLTVVARPVRLSVGDASCRVARGATAAQALRASGVRPEPGDLLDLRGGLLHEGGGLPPRVLRGGQPLALDAAVSRGDSLCVAPAANVSEPVREQTQLLAPPETTGTLPPAVVGSQRLQVGLLSGQALLETATAVPTVPAATPPQTPRMLALTFDDGPWPTATVQILDILAKHGAHATFFVVGAQAHGRPELIRRTVAEGNEVAVHTWAHANLARTSSGATIADLNRCRSALEGLTDQRVRLMRPPYGALNARARSAIAQTGLRAVLWTADTNDWRRPGADTIYARIMGGARSGAIILCHDGGGPRSGTVAAVRRAVPALQARGYQLVTVSQLLGLQPRPEGGAIILADGRRLEVKPLQPPVKLVVDGKPAVLPEDPVEMEGQLLVPVRPLLEPLRVKWVWSQQAQKLTMTGPFEQLVLRLNALKVETGPGLTEDMIAPPILYREALMVPLWAVMRVAQARALYDPATHTLRLVSFSEEMQTVAEGNVAPAEWGRGVNWRTYLGGK